MSILGSISKGFGVVRSSGSLLMVVFLFSFIGSLISLVFVSPEGAANPNAAMLATGFVFMLLSIFVQSGSIGYVEQVVKQGKSSLAVFSQTGMKSYLRMLGLGVVVFLLILVLAVVAALGFVLAGGQTALNPVAIAVAVLVAIVGAVLLISVCLAPYAVVVDGKGVIGAIKTSAGIVKRNLGTVLAVGLLLVLIGFGLGLLLGVVAGLLSAALSSVVPVKVGQALGGLVSSAVNAFLTIFTTGTFMAVYLSGHTDHTEAHPTVS